MDRYPRPVLFTMPWTLNSLAAVLVVAASIASFSFTATMARVAGVPEALTWLWPVVSGLAVAQIAYTYVMLARMPHDRIKPLSYLYLALLAAAAWVSVAENVLVITRNPTELDTLEIATVVAVPPVCLVCCVSSYALLSMIIPSRIEASIRDVGIRERARLVSGIDPTRAGDIEPTRSTIPREPTPWWQQYKDGTPAETSKSDDHDATETSQLRSQSTSEN
ncbi:hypothetical protein ACIHAX_36070 [Nocardia sp. NPDC051929]|uniref:hypothetical protein n=1 Tax=Nocardia sp. NPDC051929 TaxID=3364327 RepID=UPI0037CA9209